MPCVGSVGKGRQEAALASLAGFAAWGAVQVAPRRKTAPGSSNGLPYRHQALEGAGAGSRLRTHSSNVAGSPASNTAAAAASRMACMMGSAAEPVRGRSWMRPTPEGYLDAPSRK